MWLLHGALALVGRHMGCEIVEMNTHMGLVEYMCAPKWNQHIVCVKLKWPNCEAHMREELENGIECVQSGAADWWTTKDYVHGRPKTMHVKREQPMWAGRRALLLIGAWLLPRRPGIGRALKRHPFSGLVDSAVSLRASTRVSSGFAPLRHSSPSFGSRQACSHSNPSQKIEVGRRCNPRGDPASQLPCALRVYSPLTRTHVRLLGPCFQDGPNGSPLADARSARVPGHAVTARADVHDRCDGVSAGVLVPGLGRRRDPRRSAPRAIGGPACRRSTSDRGASPAPIRFPPDNFKHSLTLFSKSFSSFPRGTCSLSVSRTYLALDGIYRPIGAAFPNNPTRRQRLVVRQGPGTTGLSPSPAPPSRTWARSAAEDASPDYNSDAEAPILKLGSSRFARRY
ncbi:hypothetical protein GH714_043965 [Hevea brasiliensis]|uniref:Protein TAR1 n=1 Tax=Hevea brasiliensis TaxID=3981 RepID=A0A6A6K0T3_HEVBR|nr:hypothetical protein GH714_043965 [Hevea brasiliensis]